MLTSPLVIASLVDFSDLPIGYLLLSSGGVAFIPLLLGSLFLALRRVLQRLSSTITASVAKPPPTLRGDGVVGERESRSTTLTDEHILDQSSLIARLERLENEVEDLRREVEYWKGSAGGGRLPPSSSHIGVSLPPSSSHIGVSLLPCSQQLTLAVVFLASLRSIPKQE